MNRKSFVSCATPVWVALILAQSGTAATTSAGLGAIEGIVKDSRGPVAATKVLIRGLDSGVTLRASSAGDGTFFLRNVEAGQYEVSASKPGFSTVPVRIEVAAVRTTPVTVRLEASAARDAAATPPGPSMGGLEAELDSLKARISQLEALLKASTPAVPETPAPSHQIAQAPIGIPANSALPSTIPGASGSQNQAPPAPEVDLQTPFADADWTWLNGNSRQKDFPLDSKYFTGEFRADTHYGVDFNQPKDHSMGGSSEVFRNGEVQLEDLSIGGDFHAGNMRGRVLALFGMFSATTPRNDASSAVGQWDVRTAYRYISEAYGGYHFNVNHGLNIDAGIFVSYVGLFSYHNYDNWAYQPSYVSSNTPWFFNGVRIQWFPTQHLKIEPWIINGWQSYNKFNGHPGLGGQIRWSPKPWLNIIGNQYAVGNDNIGLPHRGRYHTDDSVEVKYYDKPKSGNGIDKIAFTVTGDAGCETGQGVTCHGGKDGPKQSFLGFMAYNRFWWHKDQLAMTLGGGKINNPGRYLALVLPVNGADAVSGTPYFPSAPGLPFKAWDTTATFDWMPSQFTTFRLEFGYRHANQPYWTGRQGITPPGGNNGLPAYFVCAGGASSMQTDLTAAQAACGTGGLWYPDLRHGQALLMLSVMVKL